MVDVIDWLKRVVGSLMPLRRSSQCRECLYVRACGSNFGVFRVSSITIEAEGPPCNMYAE